MDDRSFSVDEEVIHQIPFGIDRLSPYSGRRTLDITDLQFWQQVPHGSKSLLS